jgi:DNA topoisomerase IB
MPTDRSTVAESQLRLAHGLDPGISRVGDRGAFTYVDASGRLVSDPPVLGRIGSLAIPPAWSDVWISADANSHLQATGIDSRGRKQYRYHPAWRHDRDELKFSDMEAFGRVQPRLRGHVSQALSEDRQLSHRRVLALSLRLLDVGLFRVGSDRYARDNQHYGLTTLLSNQLTIRNRQAVFDYTGKAGRRQRLSIVDPEALEVLAPLRRRHSGPAELLAYRGARGWTRIHREDVNNFLRVEAAGPFSAKEYRTWNATVLAAVALAKERPRASRAAAVASQAAAAALGNTPAIARRSYIDPRILDLYAAGEVLEAHESPSDGWQARARVEEAVLELLSKTSSRKGLPEQDFGVLVLSAQEAARTRAP